MRLSLIQDPGGRARRLMLALIAMSGLSAQSYGPPELDESFSKATFVLSASSLACYRLDLWIARERSQQRRGLMFVRELPTDAGMLFIYDSPAILSMWMKNTYLPLDMLFIRTDGTISSIAADTEPLSLRSIAATEPVSYVLELNAGVAARLGIVAGDRLVL